MGSLPVTPCKAWAEGTKVCAHAWCGLREHRFVVAFSCYWGKVTPNREASHNTNEMLVSSVGQKADRYTGLASRS